ncbi:MAG: ImmA/IrrE family metallo-endopeptidase [Clostridiales bacterium]|nr:ImmA/IrrE family metallo-endopeptidase [Clostridiales bacterium]
MKPDFKLAYTKANILLVTTEAINSFPFSSKELIKERTDIRCRSYRKAKEYCVDMRDFGSESAALMGYHGKMIIFYDDAKPVTHINFSILHELGHSDMEHKKCDEHNELYDKQEVEANAYAAQILMPEQLLRYLQHRGIRISVPFLVENFGVSEPAAQKRIKTISNTVEEWRSRAEKEYDDIILEKYLPLINHLCPCNQFDYEEEFNMQRERDRWNSRRW